MCLFCAAVPMAASLGAAATAKQKQAKREKAQSTPGEQLSKAPCIRAEHITGVVIVGLLVGSALYHSQISPV